MSEDSPETSGGRRLRLARWRSRMGVSATLTALASTLAIVVTPTAAQAVVCGQSGTTCVPCPSTQTMTEDGLEWFVTFGGALVPAPANQGFHFVSSPVTEITSYTPTFLVSQEKVVQNPSSQAVTATFTSTFSQTFTLTQSLSIASGTNSTSNGFAQTLTDTIGTTISVSFTTSVGVNAAVAVPPGTEVIGDFGVPAYNVTYQEVPVVAVPPVSVTSASPSLPAGTVCALGGTVQTGTATAPQPLDGWRVNNPQPIS